MKLYPRDEKSIMTHPDSFLTTLLGQWIPLGGCVLNAVVEHVPNPCALNDDRVKQLLRQTDEQTVSSGIEDAFAKCDPSSPLAAAFISKMISVPKSELPQHRRGPLTMDEIRARRAKAEEAGKENLDNGVGVIVADNKADKPLVTVDERDHVFIAIARVFSGTLRVGDPIFALGAKHKVGTNNFAEEIIIGQLYLLMGRDLVETDSAPAGSLVGIGGVQGGDAIKFSFHMFDLLRADQYAC